MGLPFALASGTIIGSQYMVHSLINSGGFGAVYRGVDTSEGNRPCAIKETYDVTPASRRQALMEASILLTVRSKHLTEVYDAFEENGRFYLVMQLIEGKNLLELLQDRVGQAAVGLEEPHQLVDGPFSEQEILAWLLPVMDVLQELHSRNPAVIHRDIKPGNLILTPQQTAVLVDFGLTKLYDPDTNTQTLVKAVTAGFSPIEQYLGKTNQQSDIYSMAATMYLLLTNRLPPPAIARGAHDELLAPRLLNPTLSARTERALLKALSVHADQRYQSMRELAQALQEPVFTGHADPTVAFAVSQNAGNPPTRQVQSPTPTAPVTSGPAFTGHADQTIAVSPPLSHPQPPKIASPAQVKPPAKSKPAHVYTGVGGQQAQRSPNAGYQTPPMPYPYVSPSAGSYGMAPQLTVVKTVNRPVPSAFGQGCLWGLVQSVTGALLVLFLKDAPYFYLAIFTGFVFFTLAGFTTTFRGGSSFRGAWAGLWAGITSSLLFWAVLGIGLLIQVVVRLQSEFAGGEKQRDWLEVFNRVWKAELPTFPPLPTFISDEIPGNSRPLVSVFVLLIIGVIIAFALGLAGGLLGSQQNKAGATVKTRATVK